MMNRKSKILFGIVLAIVLVISVMFIIAFHRVMNEDNSVDKGQIVFQESSDDEEVQVISTEDITKIGATISEVNFFSSVEELPVVEEEQETVGKEEQKTVGNGTVTGSITINP